MSRLVNCLNGFVEEVNVCTSNNEQIANIIINVKQKYIHDTSIDVLDKIKMHVIGELKERNYDNNIIDEWINYIE